MAGNKYLEHNTTGGSREVEATQTGGGGNADKIPALDASGRLDTTMMPTGIGADTEVIEASETLSAGDFVNIHASTGAKVRKADATTSGKEAHGFVIAGVTSGQDATVYFEGNNGQVSGQTAGSVVYLHTTAGGATSTAPTTSGNIVQRIGIATTATNINFEPKASVELA